MVNGLIEYVHVVYTSYCKNNPPPFLDGLLCSSLPNPSNQLSVLVYGQHSINPLSLYVTGDTPPAHTSAFFSKQ